MTSRYKAAAPVSLRPIQMGCVTRSRIGQFNTHVKGGQLENSLSYCILRSKLCKSEQGNNMTSRKIILYVQYTYHYKYHDAICQDVRITVFSNAKTLKCDLSCAKMSHNLGCLSWHLLRRHAPICVTSRCQPLTVLVLGSQVLDNLVKTFQHLCTC